MVFFQKSGYATLHFSHNVSAKGGTRLMSDPGMLQVVLMGLITVFVGLICLIIIIVILRKIM